MILNINIFFIWNYKGNIIYLHPNKNTIDFRLIDSHSTNIRSSINVFIFEQPMYCVLFEIWRVLVKTNCRKILIAIYRKVLIIRHRCIVTLPCPYLRSKSRSEMTAKHMLKETNLRQKTIHHRELLATYDNILMVLYAI